MLAVYLGLLLLPSGLMAVSDDMNLKQCERLYQSNGTSKFVLCGLLRKRLLLVDSDYLLYDLPPARLSTRLYLNSTSAVSVLQGWSSLQCTNQSTDSTVLFKHSVTVELNHSYRDAYVLVQAQAEKGTLHCCLYSISEKKTVHRSYRYQFGVTDEHLQGHWISCPGQGCFMVIEPAGQVMRRYILTGESVRQDGPALRLCKQSDTFQGNTLMLAVSLANDSKSDQCNYQMDWKLGSNSAGFTDLKWVYLFGPDLVYIFDYIVLAQSGTAVNVKTLTYEDFVVCRNEDQGTTDIPRMNKVVALVLILVTFVAIACGLALHVYIRQRGAFQDKPKTVTKSPRPKSKKSANISAKNKSAKSMSVNKS